MARVESSASLLIIVVTVAVCTVDCLSIYYPEQCTSSDQCQNPEGSCCRTSTGIIDRQEGQIDPPEATSGTCGRLSKLGEECIPGSCGCVEGTTCYRPIQGACCPVYRCYDAVWAKEQEDYWDKCRTGKIICHFPPMAPPGGDPGLTP